MHNMHTWCTATSVLLEDGDVGRYGRRVCLRLELSVQLAAELGMGDHPCRCFNRINETKI